ncbi:MAG: archaeosine synthase subunit alpha [Halobacteria archaeon]|nr:archaeosine synthase subunit alpha [Halobacteria archaeon]
MTDYFEVHERDGPARLGEIRLDESLTTPCLVGDVLEDYGSLWTGEREMPEGNPSKISILPHRSMPSGTPEEIVDNLQVSHDKNSDSDLDFPTASVMSVEKPEATGHDMYILTGLQDGYARQIFDRITEARRTLEPDSALMLPSMATPRNVSMLSYLGCDAFDDDYAVTKGYGETYMTRELEVPIDKLDELPCSCPVCLDSTPDDLSREEIARHNVNTLRAELANVRDKIRNGKIREYVEGQSRSARWLVEAMRLVDQEWDYAEVRTPVARMSRLESNSSETIDRVEIQRFARRVLERYRAPRTDVAVLLPCSAKKPYSESDSHSDFTDSIRGRAHEVIVTSPLGVVPRELELTYPAGHYDTPVTGRWDAKERDFVSQVFDRYIENNDYHRIVAHLPEEGYAEIVRSVAEEKDIDVEFTVPEGGHPRDDEALDALDEALKDEMQASYSRKDKWFVEGVASYQFGRGVLDGVDLRTEGRIPRLRVFSGGDQIATLVPQYGLLSLTLEGVDVFDPFEVEIDEFVPQGSVLAPGIVDADGDIRVGDEVYFEGPEARGVGRARMFGEEMVRSTRGVSVDARHVEEK